MRTRRSTTTSNTAAPMHTAKHAAAIPILAPAPMPSSRPAMKLPTITTNNAPPTQSIVGGRLCLGRTRGRKRHSTTSAMMAVIGVTKNAARQPNISVSAPPRIGPKPLATANEVEISACHLMRRFGSGNKSTGAVKAVAVIMPPPSPCTARNAISCSMDCARPHSKDPSAMMLTDTRMNGLRPNRSPKRPKIGMNTAEVSKYAVPTHAYKAMPPNSFATRGKMLTTMVRSKAISTTTAQMPVMASSTRLDSCSGSRAGSEAVLVTAIGNACGRENAPTT